MSATPNLWMSEAEYLAAEGGSEVKHHYVNGEMFAMAGGSYAHAIACNNVGAALRASLQGRPCRVSNSDARVRVDDTGAYCYPDVAVVCGTPVAHGPSRAITNPTVLVEVLSPGTSEADRGWKWRNYQRIPTLQVYVLVDPLARTVEWFTREADGRWLYEQATPRQAAIRLAAVEVDLPLHEVFAGLDGLGPDGEPLPEPDAR